MSIQKYELEERLLRFSLTIIFIVQNLSNDRFMSQVASQIIKSTGTLSLHYRKAKEVESLKEYVHEMNMLMSELKQVLISLKIIQKNSTTNAELRISNALNESRELTSVFAKKIEIKKRDQIASLP